ncbi:LolA family protein [Sinosporangium siamense]|uniref:Membrane protein n=1 Tax=Sinosporangium siamense TaxID=1367973 RepID=A0A919V902_9ACTN|nr:DUF2092 domain-containing protein [Sinosporangium siamense]GII93782.1 membrane protein [Sinosporangium siamense]
MSFQQPAQDTPSRLRRLAMKWGAPVTAVLVVAAVLGAPSVIAAVRGEPSLPARTAEQLVTDALRSLEQGRTPPLSGTIVKTASLGVPGVSQLLGNTPPRHGAADIRSPLSLLVGAHQVKLWYDGATRVRAALPGPMSETDVIVNDGVMWIWESESNTANKIKLPAGAAAATTGVAAATVAKGAAHAVPPLVLGRPTPGDAAKALLSMLAASTEISVADDETVAGRPAYHLILAPKDPDSLIAEVRLALDGEKLFPLRLQVVADGSDEPVIDIGYTEITFSPPAEENFTFTPPHGATVNETSFADLMGQSRATTEEWSGDPVAGTTSFAGSGWTAVSVTRLDKDDLAELAAPPKVPARQEEGGAAEFVRTVLDSATPVQGPWGSGRMVKSKLVTVLLTDDGRLLIGAVTPQTLIEAAGRG